MRKEGWVFYAFKCDKEVVCGLEFFMKETLSEQAKKWVEELGMQQHPEGGWFAEVYRSAGFITQQALPGHKGARPYMTSIYFMLPPGEISRFHRLKSDEIWYFHAGGSLVIHQIDSEGRYFAAKLGQNIAAGEQMQVIVQAGSWFGAETTSSEAALVGCAVAPGFDFADFELADRQVLLAGFGAHAAIIERLTKSDS